MPRRLNGSRLYNETAINNDYHALHVVSGEFAHASREFPLCRREHAFAPTQSVLHRDINRFTLIRSSALSKRHVCTSVRISLDSRLWIAALPI